MFRIAMVRAHISGSPLLGNPETEGGGGQVKSGKCT